MQKVYRLVTALQLHVLSQMPMVHPSGLEAVSNLELRAYFLQTGLLAVAAAAAHWRLIVPALV
jgi:hypothetical protein